MIVADTNLLAYLLLPGERTEAAEAVWRRDPEWHAPLLWRSELRNVLAVKLRRQEMSLPEAVRVAGEARRLMEGREHLVDGGHVLRLAGASGLSAYDCEFVATAEALSAPLVSADRDLVAAFPGVASPPKTFASTRD
jgi:predicted nucleic acid-binding protein